MSLHPSLLPLYRGAAPVQRALERGDVEGGVSLAYSVLEMDAGPVLAACPLPLPPEANAHEVLDRAFAVGTDLLLDMMLTASPSVDPTGVEGGLGAIRGHVQVTVPATTLAGTTAGGAQLNGKCAVDPETAKILAGNAPGFDRVFLDPITGTVLAVDRRFATPAQKRYLVARDIRCRFPGCRRPATECDIDHREDWALGGKTDIENMGAFCESHHALKQAAGWTVVQMPGGRLHFTAPSGLEYDDDPPPRVMFMPDGVGGPGGAQGEGTDQSGGHPSTSSPLASWRPHACDLDLVPRGKRNELAKQTATYRSSRSAQVGPTLSLTLVGTSSSPASSAQLS